MRLKPLLAGMTTRLGMLALLTTLHAVANAEPGLALWTGPNPAPAIELKTLDGQPFRLQQLQGKVVLVNFWATWCGPCVEEMPSMQKLRKHLAAAPFEIVAVNSEEGEPKIRKFLQKVPVDFPIVRDTDGAVTRAWKARVFPSSFLLDVEGRIRYAIADSADWSSPDIVKTIESLLPAK